MLKIEQAREVWTKLNPPADVELVFDDNNPTMVRPSVYITVAPAIAYASVHVNTAALEVIGTPGAFAGIVGHELGHYTFKERLAGLDPFEVNMRLLFGIPIPGAHQQEFDSDIEGLKAAAAAGFDPREAIEVHREMLRRYPKIGEDNVTHPSMVERLRRMEQWVESGRTPQA